MSSSTQILDVQVDEPLLRGSLSFDKVYAYCNFFSKCVMLKRWESQSNGSSQLESYCKYLDQKDTPSHSEARKRFINYTVEYYNIIIMSTFKVKISDFRSF